MWLLRTAALLALSSSWLGAASASCPAVCACKWKGGKQTVECVERGLITLPANVNPETQVLDVTGNNLQILPRDTFIRANLLNLQKVYLRSCRIGQIDDRAFNGLTNLVELDLSYNLLTSIPSATFKDVPFLRDVTLAYNPIIKIEADAFGTLPGLVRLDLSHCEITTVAPRAFDGVEHLETLKLNANRLTELKPRTVESLSRLHGAELHDNPWICDCRLRAARLWLVDHNIPAPVPPTCAGGPERVLDRAFHDLDADDFACRPEILPSARYVEAAAGENATVVCRVRAVPQATVTWFWSGRLLLNDTAFGAPHQRLFIFEDDRFEKSSSLVLANAQETDATEFYCVAENRAGTAEANFTVHVSLRAAGMATLGSSQIAGLSAALVILILFILLLILVLLVRLRRLPFSESKTPAPHHRQAEAGVVGPGANSAAIGNSYTKPPSAADHATSGTAFQASAADKLAQAGAGAAAAAAACNPVQKPPRMTEIPYTTSHYDGGGSVLVPPLSSVAAPTPVTLTSSASAAAPLERTTSSPPPPNNPDLIRDARAAADSVSTTSTATTDVSRPSAPGACCSSSAAATAHYPAAWDSPGGSPDLFMRRATSAFDASDKTPIIVEAAGNGCEDYTCRTLPRYPPDYGLPPVPPPGTKAAAQRVWQRGVPVLPPVTALKRVLSRNSPDEGYQEGPGTDV
ncbi:leucine-rich repeat-containing protein 24 [Schistocerca nitens]|uniref:leucine-rich repeat-containing protein 24 n=1 Tax=Schistocerca nitens TaxID=7011 RepID=UPI002118C24A|nr:leucine-rich repeat-containing protein 24 [Schistocerca nitens]